MAGLLIQVDRGAAAALGGSFAMLGSLAGQIRRGLLVLVDLKSWNLEVSLDLSFGLKSPSWLAELEVAKTDAAEGRVKRKKKGQETAEEEGEKAQKEAN
ncbi:hypothetical protein Droror1_Dr00027623 [Drosera rotundifolia]